MEITRSFKQVIHVEYKNLTRLISEHRDSRRYFMSLPVELQLRLHNRSESIHTPQQLFSNVDELNEEGGYLNKYNNPFSFLRNNFH